MAKKRKLNEYYRGLKDILIVEDDKSLRDTLVDCLKDMAVFRNIIQAENGSEAVMKINNQKFLAIILDINMPKINGIEVVSILHKQGIPVDNIFMISGEVSKDSIQKVMAMGVKHIFTKPFDLIDFENKITEITKDYSNR